MVFYILNIYVNFLLIISFLGILINRKNLLLIIICLEIALVSVSLKFFFLSLIFKDGVGFFFMIMILTMAAAETAIGLSLLISYFKIKGDISIKNINLLGK